MAAVKKATPVPRFTPEDVWKHWPCGRYSRDRIKQLFGRRKSLSARQIAMLSIPAADVLWALDWAMSQRDQAEVIRTLVKSDGVDLYSRSVYYFCGVSDRRVLAACRKFLGCRKVVRG